MDKIDPGAAHECVQCHGRVHAAGPSLLGRQAGGKGVTAKCKCSPWMARQCAGQGAVTMLLLLQSHQPLAESPVTWQSHQSPGRTSSLLALVLLLLHLGGVEGHGSLQGHHRHTHSRHGEEEGKGSQEQFQDVCMSAPGPLWRRMAARRGRRSLHRLAQPSTTCKRSREKKIKE